ncbi:hypothetical protein CYMTET_30297 [Cymbomonas tetramitiformis]|uniref:Uncharacterized protein n=1 Tax=Cymbomonas tetramitiformis TaxID=36881 RepID=A0AAE0KU27_9CHLO|nr:hypothetical protein CYMTET_30297 [Cymbomonas tetramitiformis]
MELSMIATPVGDVGDAFMPEGTPGVPAADNPAAPLETVTGGATGGANGAFAGATENIPNVSPLEEADNGAVGIELVAPKKRAEMKQN